MERPLRLVSQLTPKLIESLRFASGDEELRFHLEKEIKQNLVRGMTPEEARRTALLSFGGFEPH